MNNISEITETSSIPPIAIVSGQALTSLPKDLFIPPNAMEVFLEAFEGPLDLLLYLIKKQNLDILNIPIAEVTRQYMDYVELMSQVSLELAAEYLVMAALLAEIKSRMLLPRPENAEGIEEDPRAELIRRLQEYERFKKVADELDQLPRQGRDTFVASAGIDNMVFEKPLPEVDLKELLLAFADVLKRAQLTASHQIQMEPLSVRERMTRLLSALEGKEFITFSSLFTLEEGRLGIVVSFLAMLELLKDHLIEFVQATPFGPIHLKAAIAGERTSHE
ncbi:MAG: segregation/condensation protein A [Gammaproteobacteria bacterium]|nr:segregation/condensation protein A [Gammaproteobacteria bacterium]